MGELRTKEFGLIEKKLMPGDGKNRELKSKGVL